MSKLIEATDKVLLFDDGGELVLPACCEVRHFGTDFWVVRGRRGGVSKILLLLHGNARENVERSIGRVIDELNRA